MPKCKNCKKFMTKKQVKEAWGEEICLKCSEEQEKRREKRRKIWLRGYH